MSYQIIKLKKSNIHTNQLFYPIHIFSLNFDQLKLIFHNLTNFKSIVFFI